MKPAIRFFGGVVCLILVFVLSTIGISRAAPLRLEPFNGGFFTIYKPSGWRIVTAGQCGTFAFLMRDPSNPLRQIFYFGEVGPVYMSSQQKQLDRQYMNMGGYPISWIEMPVVAPLTPTNFLVQFHKIARTNVARAFMPQCPRLDDIHVIHALPQPSAVSGGNTELIRALFMENNRLGEGLFTVTVAPLSPFTGGTGGGTGYGFLITGVTAPKGEFRDIEKGLVEALGSFNIGHEYVQQCLRQQAAAYRAVMRAGDTLRETSNMIMRGWENRNRTYDILAEKWSDTILGKERLYNPNTGEVYEFENGFYDQYDLNRNRYDMNNLKRLPENDYTLWMRPPLDGPAHLR